MHVFFRLETWTTRVALTGAIVTLIAAAALAFFQVVTRFVFDQPSTWSEVLTRSAMIWSVFLGAAPAFRGGSMIAMEIVQRVLPGLWGKALNLFANGLSLVFFSILFWQGIGMTRRVAGQALAAVEISISWVYAALPVGSAFAIIAILACIGRELLRVDDPDARGETADHAPV
ncbi:MAG: TRAP transporter small permease [Inquilinaceae bacterium]